LVVVISPSQQRRLLLLLRWRRLRRIALGRASLIVLLRKALVL
jgi:hypothetical protein